MVDPDGKTWYGTRDPAFDLRHLDLQATYVAHNLPGGEDMWGAVVWVEDRYRDALRSWSRERSGQHAGITVAGRLVEVAPIRIELTSGFQILFKTKAEAEEVAERIRRGGLASPASQTSDSRRGQSVAGVRAH
jgi:hypothetical protein